MADRYLYQNELKSYQYIETPLTVFVSYKV